MSFILGERKTVLLVERETCEGVRRIAGRVAEDIEAVTGIRPEIKDSLNDGDAQVVLCSVLGESSLAEKLAGEGVLDNEALRGKREVYALKLTKLFDRDALIICGSDKRGAIYGMFALSEYIGVSPLCFWGDVTPVRQQRLPLGEDIETISREPSVKYRGFFINDEWPCFGSWATSHFGDVNADCYERVFELLLRLKGNYLWPAMWRSSFPLDGPDSANEELADLYGVVMGYSHHEPCLRASEEWDKVRGEGSRYGNEWNFYTNEEGLLHYWEDALKRSGRYENIITIGMRGERDTSMLGENSTLAENIELLKRIILKQRSLIREYVHRDGSVPQLLALYKEVERYFYGDASTEGLKNWDELRDVIFMLCEDNFGHMRTLPPPELRDHPGGWGMYYHFDYHGGPVSYEWLDSTTLVQTWEQMTEAFEYGIRDVWIVNVGDIKLHEVPLSYFLTLAYDFDKWGSGNPHSAEEYISMWTKSNFPRASEEQRKDIGRVLTDYVQMNSLRRPESLHPLIYSPYRYGETERMLAMVHGIELRSQAVYNSLSPEERDTYYSMVHFSAMASANLVKMHLSAGKNSHYAAQGKPVANRWALLTEECIRRDMELAEEFGMFRGGKWDGMQLARHIGFTKWNEDDWRYPVLHYVTPTTEPFMKVSRRDSERIGTKKYGPPDVIMVEDFLYAGCDSVVLEIANSGEGSFAYSVAPVDGSPLPPWLTVTPREGIVTEQEEIILACDRDLLPHGEQRMTLIVTDGDARVAVEVAARTVDLSTLPAQTYVERDGVIAILAEHFCEKTDVPGGFFRLLPGFGKAGSGMKVTPSTASFSVNEEKPSLSYSFLIEEAGEYQVDVLTAPNNPVYPGSSVSVLLEIAGERRVLELIPNDFRAGENSDSRWSSGVLDQLHMAGTRFRFEKGVQRLTIGAMDPGVVLEELLIRRTEKVLDEFYLCPEETACKK